MALRKVVMSIDVGIKNLALCVAELVGDDLHLRMWKKRGRSRRDKGRSDRVLSFHKAKKGDLFSTSRLQNRHGQLLQVARAQGRSGQVGQGRQATESADDKKPFHSLI